MKEAVLRLFADLRNRRRPGYTLLEKSAPPDFDACASTTTLGDMAPPDNGQTALWQHNPLRAARHLQVWSDWFVCRSPAADVCHSDARNGASRLSVTLTAMASTGRSGLSRQGEQYPRLVHGA